MSRRDTMRDPRYSGILLEIERKLHDADGLAVARRLTLTDSNIRSLLVRAINEVKDKAAKSANGTVSDKDRFLAEAPLQLAAVRTAIVEERYLPDGTVQQIRLPAAEWIASREAIEDSCAGRTGRESGSRGYLEFLRGFICDRPKAP